MNCNQSFVMRLYTKICVSIQMLRMNLDIDFVRSFLVKRSIATDHGEI